MRRHEPGAAARATPLAAEPHPVVAALGRGMSPSAGAAHGVKWLGPARVIAIGCQFLSLAVTARLLTPGQFGQAAIALAIANFAQLFTDLGLSAAVIHVPVPSRRLLSTAFWLNLSTGVGLTVLVSALALPLAAIYGRHGLVPLIVVASLSFTLSCGVVQVALLERTQNFARLAVYETISALIGGVATPLLALAGAGTVSLVLGPTLTTAVLSGLLWARVAWTPDVAPSRAAMRDLWRFSRGLVGFNVVNYWARNADTLVLGRFVSLTALGEYTRAFSLTMVPVQQMNAVLGRVLFPALARMNDDPQRVARAWVRGTRTSALLVLPATVTLAAAAPAVIELLFGPRWSGMTTVLELLALATVPQLIGAATGSLFRATGHTGLLFRVGLLSASLSVVAILVGAVWGTTGVAAALLIKSFVGIAIVLGALARVVGVATRELLLPFLTAAIPSLGLATGEVAVRVAAGSQLPPLVVLTLQLAAGGALLVLVGWRWGDRADKRMVISGLRALQQRVRTA